jgi:hypothetical protein
MKSSSTDNKDSRDNIPLLNFIVAIYLIVFVIQQLIR